MQGKSFYPDPGPTYVSVELLKAAQEENERLREELNEHKAARVAYANEFDSDVGSIHENIRRMKSEVRRLRGEIEELTAPEPITTVENDYNADGLSAHITDYLPAGTKLYLAPGAPSGWIRAIDEALVTAHLGVANAEDSYAEARRKLGELIDWHVTVATDPVVNGGYLLVPVEPTETMPYPVEE